jgi:diamine N-acetyltransferase
MSDIMIRAARADDFGFVRDLRREVGRMHAQAEPKIFVDEEITTKENFKREAEEGTVLVAEIDDEPMGCCRYSICASKKWPGLRVRTICHINDISVSARFHRRGVGKILYEAACAKARDVGCDAIDLNVWSFNEGAVAFYESIGMRCISRRFEQEL